MTTVFAFRPLAGCGLILAIALVAGCGGGGDPKDQVKAKVAGKITLDKLPLKTGKIVFDPGDGTPPADMTILDGNFEGTAPVGKCKVSITAFEKMTMKEKMRRDKKPVVEGPGYDDLVEFNLLPERYNMKSDIKREVEAGKLNEFNFELESK